MTNFRPISLISNSAKIFEKIIHRRLLGFIERHKLIAKRQYGFMKKMGIRDALNYLTDLIYGRLDISAPVAVTFLDLAKAFDTVNHDILLDKLYNYGIRGKALQLLTSYLEKRCHRVKINDVLSDYCELAEKLKFKSSVLLRSEEAAVLMDVGDDEPSQLYSELGKKLLNDHKWMPLWSCVARPKFGYGRIPASSAPVEGHFSIVKNQIFKFCAKPVRADNFVETYLKYLEGSLKIASSELTNLTEEETNEKDEETDGAILATQEEENWRGLGNKNEMPKSLYLTKNYEVFDALEDFKKVQKIPLIKNGNHPSLRAIDLEGSSYSLRNTCAFDSLVQIFLVGFRDKEEIRISLEKLASEDIVKYISSKGINTHSYRMRTMILKNLFDTNTKHITENNYSVDCECNVISLISKIFADLPSMKEVSVCENGCTAKHKDLRVLSVDHTKIGKNSENIIGEHIVLRGKQKCAMGTENLD
ncbi:uncharacterized protein LOC123317695 [Coccinella septempunctata]|uniref:uncharacterized protein LOC123317695 n=1 Tax=Coccinella septempunctata TaxID=41139 RepID=UPI001D062D8C|nr:uncharacterized protein LOC123317695 [Coccinella septempunctata]